MEQPRGRVIPFKKNAEVAKRLSAAQAKITSLVAKDALFDGVLRLRTGVKIDGIVIGGVVVESPEACMIIVDVTGEVEGNILASRAIISGAVRGNIHATEILIRGTAKIDGDIFYNRIHIEDGAEVNGQLRKMVAVQQQNPDEPQCEKPELIALQA